MRYRAIVFDLFGTLVDNPTQAQYDETLRQMAATLGIPHQDFKRLWYETSEKRQLGILPSVDANVAYVCSQLGRDVDDTVIEAAVEIRRIWTSLKPRSDAPDTLRALRQRGFKVGLVSNCSPDTPPAWELSDFAPLFDATIFSSSVGMWKPDPRIYRLALERLGVKPEEAMFVGDGDSNELTGATNAGMSAIMISVPVTEKLVSHQQEWHGPVVTSLSGLLELID
jgi:putative hydrolase of the HAD superfamily